MEGSGGRRGQEDGGVRTRMEGSGGGGRSQERDRKEVEGRRKKGGRRDE